MNSPSLYSSIVNVNLSQRILFAGWSKLNPRWWQRKERRIALAILLALTVTAGISLMSIVYPFKEDTDKVLGHALNQQDADSLGLPSSSQARLYTDFSHRNPWRGAGNRRRDDLLTSISGCGGTYRRKLQSGDSAALFYVVREANSTIIDSTQKGIAVNIVLGAQQVGRDIEYRLAGMCAGETASFHTRNGIFTVHVSQIGQVNRDDKHASRLEELAKFMQAVGAPRGMSCVHTCRASGLECADDGFRIINECPRLRKMFPCGMCETAAAGSSGPDMPCYVEPSAPLGHPRGFCMVNPKVESSTCTAKYKHTRRLCPCVPEKLKT